MTGLVPGNYVEMVRVWRRRGVGGRKKCIKCVMPYGEKKSALEGEKKAIPTVDIG